MVTKGQEISKAKEDLVAAEEKEAQQYEDMKLRIKYMYEEGDEYALERILGSGTIAEVLSQAEYVQKIHSYDRSMLQEYAETVEEVETLKSTLENDMTKLENLEGEYKSQSNELSTMLSSKQAEVENLDVMIQEAAKAALEEQKKKEAAEARRKRRNRQQAQGRITIAVLLIMVVIQTLRHLTSSKHQIIHRTQMFQRITIIQNRHQHQLQSRIIMLPQGMQSWTEHIAG